MKASIASIVLFLSLVIAVPVSLPAAYPKVDLSKRGDTAPVMTNAAKEIVPFDTAGVVAIKE
ncbi:hypothetical protein MMC24_004563 [Lignoscripta atroalba]|nr:hypothetical protein [Lignoscripta atroalba]